MRVVGDSLVLSPTDLSSFLNCRHRIGLELAVARGELTRPTAVDAFAAILQRLGEEHEQRYVEALRARGLRVVDAKGADGAARTLAAMCDAADVIVQARLEGDGLAGYADVLIRVNAPSDLGAWSYEVQDTKLARETKGGTILQLSAYSALLAGLQGTTPECFHVVTPDPLHPVHSYRVEEYAAYYRMVLASLREAVQLGHETLLDRYYPEPVDACDVCRWEVRCIGRRRADDHLSFIANTGRLHRVELTMQGHGTLASVAMMPVPVTFTPGRGARETYNRIGEQARVQHSQRETRRPVFERLAVTPGEGLCRLPAPSPGDLFLDLEGARFAREGGREYLFGLWDGQTYRAFWASDDREEKIAFETVMDVIATAWARDPGMHVYHFNHYEPTAFKKLMGRHVTRAEALDQLLRAERFVDLYPIVRQAVRAGVESYSIKKLELYTGYTRAIDLAGVHQALMATELALETGAAEAITDEIRHAVAGYNQDDCRSLEALRAWLASIRDTWIAQGVDVPRPQAQEGDASPEVSELQKAAEALRARLLEGLADEASSPAHSDHPRWLLAYLLDFHKREENAEWWEYYRLKELPADELLDESQAIVGLEHMERVDVVLNKKTKRPTGSVVDRYHYPPQDVEIRRGAKLKLQDGDAFGEVLTHDREARCLVVKKGPARAEVHPDAVFASDVISTRPLQLAVMRLADAVATAAPTGTSSFSSCGVELLHRCRPRVRSASFEPGPGETAQQFAVRIATSLDRTTLAIQGPPGAGKTYVGAQMIRALLREGRRVGVTAISHKVIRNLLDEVMRQAQCSGETVRAAVKVTEAANPNGGTASASTVIEIAGNEEALAALASGNVHVLGGTAWLWAREEAAAAVEVLFVDEAGQMSLATALAVSHAADSVVLLGDPQQLEQPQKAAHPDGVGVSALQHVLGAHETMPADRGIFLPTTWRMSPAICAFTSELFYEGKLDAKPSLAAQVLRGTSVLDGSHLWLVPVDHDGNQSACDEEVEAVTRLVDLLLQPASQWVDENGIAHAITPQDIRVVAPFNAQVNRLSDRLGARGVPIGTVDKFQGQTSAVVIYSMTTSRPEDAPRGMEFLYSLNRLNVATSRARCAVILVASPRLFEPECRTPRQMQLANALCRYREMARVVRLNGLGT
jgi:predicted RecB family nuclease